MLIELTQEAVAQVDDGDYAWLTKYRWQLFKGENGQRYARRTDAAGRCVWMHREILGLKHGDKRVSDHINDDGLDNRRANIRIATQSQNAGRSRRGKVGLRGAVFHRGKWVASIGGTHLGRFNTPEEANAAYAKAAKERYGEFARTSN